MKYGRDTDSYGKPVDVICQHNADGTLMPMRLRVKDEDGINQTFAIKGYREFSRDAGYKLPNGFELTTDDFAYECRIEVFGMKKTIILFYRPKSGTVWRLAT